MHDYTVRLLNDSRLAQFEHEAAASRLAGEARRGTSPPWLQAISALQRSSYTRWTSDTIRWTLVKVRGA